MQISALKTSNSFKSIQTLGEKIPQSLDFFISPRITKNQNGFSLIEILVALVLAAMIFLAVPSNDAAQKHRDLQSAVNDLDRTVRFASNESVLRNTVVRIRLSLDKDPVEYVVEYGPAGNLALPEVQEKKNMSLAEEKMELDKQSALDRQFTKVEEFEDISNEISPNVTIQAMATTFQKKLIKEGEATLYFYPTGEKDGALIFFSTNEEIAYLEIAPFLTETNAVFIPLKTSAVAKLEDIIQTRMDEVYNEWQTK